MQQAQETTCEPKIIQETTQGVFTIINGDKRLKLDASLLPGRLENRINLRLCLAKHIIRLNKSIKFISNINDTYPPPDLEGDEITIVYNVGPSGLTSSTAVGIKLPHKNIQLQDLRNATGYRYAIYRTPSDVKFTPFVFKDLKGLAIAYMSSSTGALVLLFNALTFLGTPEDVSSNYLDYILTNYSTKCDEIREKAKIELELRREEKRKEEYQQFVKQIFQVSISEIKNRQNAIHRDIDAHLRGLHKKGTDLQNDEAFLKVLQHRSLSAISIKRLEKDYEITKHLRTSQKYKHFRFDSGAIVGRTHMIKLFNKYPIGCFDVYLYLDGRVKCYNLVYKDNGGIDHPHVKEGDPCYGTLDNAIFTMLRAHQFGAVFDLMHEFLSSYTDGKNSSGNKPYTLLQEGWPHLLESGLKLCNNCQRITELCDCPPSQPTVAGLHLEGANVSIDGNTNPLE